MLHLVMMEAVKRNAIVGVLIIDLEAQYSRTITHLEEMVELYKNNIDLHWICTPLLLRNAVTAYEPRWKCWEENKRDIWVREKPKYASKINYPFAVDGLEFEEIIILFGEWYAEGKTCAGFIGIRADESLNRFRTIAVFEKEMLHGKNHR